MVRFCIDTSAYVLYDEKQYKQIKGLAMGSPLSGVLADIVLDEIIKSTLDKNTFDILLIVKYVDDILIIADEDDIEFIFQEFNAADKSFGFTIEVEDNGEIPYLDVTLIKENGQIVSKWYRKPTSKGRLIDFWSNHPWHIKINCLRSFAIKVLSYSDVKYHHDCFKIIRDTIAMNHYPSKVINSIVSFAKYWYNKEKQTPTITEQQQSVFASITYCPPVSSCLKEQIQRHLPQIKVVEKPTTKLRQKIFSNTNTKIALLRKRNVVYRINCLDCEKFYIGRTRKRLEERLQQHRNDCRLRRCEGTGTALSTHAIKENHSFDFENPEIIEVENNPAKLEVKESYHIKKHSSRTVNFRVDSNRLHPLYEI